MPATRTSSARPAKAYAESSAAAGAGYRSPRWWLLGDPDQQVSSKAQSPRTGHDTATRHPDQVIHIQFRPIVRPAGETWWALNSRPGTDVDEPGEERRRQPNENT